MKHLILVILSCVFIITSPSIAFTRGGISRFNRARKITEKDFLAFVIVRAKKLEERKGFKFDEKTEFKISFVEYLGGSSNKDAFPHALYSGEKSTLLFRKSSIEDAYRNLKSFDPDDLSTVSDFAQLVDHELGHLLMDQIAKRNNLKSWFTEDFLKDRSFDERLGICIAAEGVAEYFGHTRRYTNKGEFSEEYFPVDFDKENFSYTRNMIYYGGGYWMTKDILKEYGERGIIWIIEHPFIAKPENLRESAIIYRRLALTELAELTKPVVAIKPTPTKLVQAKTLKQQTIISRTCPKSR